MGKNETKTHNMSHCDHTNIRSKIGGTNFGSPVHGGEGCEFFQIFENFQKALMRQEYGTNMGQEEDG